MIRWSRSLALVLWIAAWPCAAPAQTVSCDRLRADMAALDAGAGASGRPFAEALRRQRAELDRTVAYARSIGCQRQRIIFFGDSGPAQCGPLADQINRLESNLAGLEDQAQRSAGQAAAQRNAMAAAYDANCRGAQPATVARGPQPGLLERLFGVVPEQDPYQDPDLPPEPVGPPDPLAGGSYKTLCVRKCDGFYFPISPRTNRSRVDTDASLCEASCPNAEVELFLQPSGQEAEAAVAVDGTPYTSLPNAFRYRKAVDPSCTCRSPGQTWVEALSRAEQLLQSDGRDAPVTERQAQELSRAPDPAKAKPPAPAKAAGTRNGKAPPPAGANPAPPAPPQAAANPPAANAASVPTAGSESSGIGGSGQVGDTTLGAKQGEQKVVSTPAGRKTVRVVAPTLGPALVQSP